MNTRTYLTLPLPYGYALTVRLPALFVSRRHPGAF